MSVSFLLLSSWLMLPISITELSNFKGLSVNKPKQALVEYPILVNRYQNDTTKQVAMLHFYALSAASRARDWPAFLNILDEIFSEKLKVYFDEERLQILSKIGVAYRLNGQLEQAKKHYQCAFEFADNNIELAQLKVNQAIVFRLLEQPALAFQLLESVDIDKLSERVKAGYWVVRGNIKQSIGHFEEALESFERAHRLYLNVDNRSAEAGLTGNILSVALAANKLEVFSQYRAGFEAKASEYYPQLSDYLEWLDIIAYSYKAQSLNTANHAWLKKHVDIFVEQGFGDSIYAHLQRVGAAQLYPVGKTMKFSAYKLPEQLGKAWCEPL
ncbi:hypothetical protein CWB96_21855 [Pseudoalteromonas citrea]|uniref:Uncharacterized protein n=1 Tax=Pseudoalteromonas citrea TaxID=43655 RepID=A0A5S3XGH4_9GAMM|nr:hypothetical protein [Pseudoalteromonas citrea]TMP43223.1 hypothetical protein CWB97_09690 [Pseudoalteromonas citrea]TMP52319.1 hypothetical protein CWB96_21855 [Pseudoalteromonas citrea]